ncbi:TonB-dependent receptor [Fulvivirgaceae bacterium BMA10]|uniref:TonB-dependent receptor n=1 Tax=Splendidivirga corallicola TaxID=3051826 RepID=A0ABT8KLT1_9BACT|nr:TonB-dependent receptor [Fulvivirgaceae bacterium BMA10]
MNTLKRTFLTLVVSCLGLSSFAQTGKIKVSIFDKESGEPLIGATAQVANTTNGSVTDLDGMAIIVLDPGTYDLEVSYVSYEKKTITGVEVKDGEVTTLNVSLGSAVVGLEEVVVTAEVIKSSENAILTIQKKSPKLLDAISADQFSRSGDNDAAAAVKRVVGVTVESGKYVYVRGLGDRYSKSTLNGADVPSLDPEKNAVQLDLFPSNLIDNIIVYKTFSPDLSGEFTGGLVDITTKDFPDQYSFQISSSVGVNSQATFNKNFLTHQSSDNTTWLGFDNGRDLPNEIQGLTQSTFPQAFIDNEALDVVTKSFDNTQFEPTQKSQPFNHSFSVSVGDQKQLFGKPFGFVAGLTYNRSFSYYDDGIQSRWEEVNDQVQSLDSDQKFDYRDRQSSDEVSIGALVNTNIKLNSNNKIGLNLMHNQGGNKSTRRLDGPWFGVDDELTPYNIGESRVLSYEERGLSNGQLKGEHVIPGLNNLKIDWFSSYTTSFMNQPDLKFFFNFYTVDQANPSDTLYGLNNSRIRPSRYFRDMDESISDSKINFTFPVELAKDLESRIKTGFAYSMRDRTYKENRYEYFVRGGNTFGADIDALFTNDKLGLTSDGTLGTYLADFTQEPNNYEASQTVSAAYVMIEAALSKKFKLTTGVRFERTEREINFLDGTPVSVPEDNNDLLPALNMTYELFENSNLRFGYGRTIARPTFREFAPLVTFGYGGDNTLVGNPDLTRSLIDNFDLRWEVFPKNGEYIGFSVFYKKFNDPIERVTNPEAGGSTLEFTFVNVDRGIVYGAEAEIKKGLGFISPALDNFKISANLSLIESEVDLDEDEKQNVRTNFNYTEDTRPMFNQSPFVVNTSLIYENFETGWASSLTFNVFGERLSAFQTKLPPLLVEKPRPELNFSIKRNFTDRLSLRFRANNLLNPAYKEAMDFNGREYIFSSYTKGRSFSLSFTYTIN